MAGHDLLSKEALEMKSCQVHVDHYLQAEELGVLLDKVKSAAASLRYLRSKARNLDVPHLSIGAEQLEIEDDSSVSQVAKDISLLAFHDPGEDTFSVTGKNQDSLDIEDGAYNWKMLQSTLADVLESLLRRVTAESETSFQKERVIIGEEEIRRKTVQIENLSLKLEEMKHVGRKLLWTKQGR